MEVKPLVSYCHFPTEGRKKEETEVFYYGFEK